MSIIQTRIDNIEKRINELSKNDLWYVFRSKIDSDGSTLYQVDRGSEKEWINEAEFDKFTEENYKDKTKPFIILTRGFYP